MTDTIKSVAISNNDKPHASSGPRPLSKQQQLNKLYALPAPLRTFPLPTFVPHNPLSLFHILYVWVSQTIKPGSSHQEPLYQGWFSSETRSVHVTDTRSIRGLWEQGFYGKGSLSRSEPSWLNREETRRGNKAKVTSEEITRKRRLERQQKKWERARTEREAIDQRLLEEAEAEVKGEVQQSNCEVLISKINQSDRTEAPQIHPSIIPAPKQWVAPIDSSQLRSLPVSEVDLGITQPKPDSINVHCLNGDWTGIFVERKYTPPVGPLELLALPNSLTNVKLTSIQSEDADWKQRIKSNGQTNLVPAIDSGTKQRSASYIDALSHKESKIEDADIVGGSETNDETNDGSTHSEDTGESDGIVRNGIVKSKPAPPRLKHQKSVRFSPTVEKNTFIQSEPPNPEHASTSITVFEQQSLAMKDQEHIQLTLEEAFFLSYALGALEILCPKSQKAITNEQLFTIFRKTSYFPPTANPILSPDDPFMVNYVVYHHFRSLGWVPRSGVKFSVDLMIYLRGPVFTHAEFGVIILPSYSDPHWSSNPFLQNYVKGKESRTWAWISCINRVISQAKKTLVLVYVDIPCPIAKEEEERIGINGVLGRYKVTEVVMKRWVGNRMRG